MSCQRYREAVSALLDGEEPGVPPGVIERHLVACAACRRWRDGAAALARAGRIGPAEQVPDLTAAILQAAGTSAQARHGHSGVVRVALAVVAVAQLGLGLSDLLGGDGATAHSIRELGSWDLALALGFLVAARRPARSWGMSPLVAAVVGAMVLSSGIDLASGDTVLARETPHVLAIAGMVLLWFLACSHGAHGGAPSGVAAPSEGPSRTGAALGGRFPERRERPVGIRTIPGTSAARGTTTRAVNSATGRVLARVTVAAGAAVLLLVGGAGPAAAHATLRGSEPADRQVLDTGPDEVVLRFSESVGVSRDSVKVLDDHGQVVVAKGATHRPGDRSAVVIRLPDLEEGAYVATWRVISADSHPSVGAITFRVGDVGDDFHIGGSLLEAPKGDPLVGFLFGVARFAAYAALVALVGAVAFLAVLWPAGFGRPRPALVVRTAWLASVVATAVAVVVQNPYINGEGLGAALSPSALGELVGERYGQVGLVRLALLVLLWAVVLRPFRRPGPEQPEQAEQAEETERTEAAAARAPAGLAPLGLTLLAVLATLALVGHPITGRWVPLAVAADIVHLAAVSLWLGGLVLVVAFLLDRERATELAAVLPRFSRLAFGAVVAIVATGTFQSVRQLDGLGDLTSTTYGRLLLTKVAVVAGLVALGGLSRRFLRAHVARPAPVAVAVGPGAAALDPEVDLTRRLRRSVGAEVVVGVAVLAVTSLLVNAVPARSVADQRVAIPFSTELVQGELKAVITVEPALSGLNDIHVYTFDTSGRPKTPLEVTATLSQPAAGIAPLRVPLGRNGEGHYSSFGFEVPLPGTWKIDVAVLVGEFDQLHYLAEVPVR